MKYSKIEVRVAITQDRALDGQCDDIIDCDTIAAAKKYAKRCLTDEYMRLNEMTQPLGYSQVVADGQVLYDYFRD